MSTKTEESRNYLHEIHIGAAENEVNKSKSKETVAESVTSPAEYQSRHCEWFLSYGNGVLFMAAVY